MAGKSQLLPADTWVASSVTEKRLEELVRDGKELVRSLWGLERRGRDAERSP
jgi:hypothetical protein